MPNQLGQADFLATQILENADCDTRASEHTENNKDYRQHSFYFLSFTVSIL
jgi:hypothetical protein